MSTTLLEVVRDYLDHNADANGLAQTPIPGLTVIRALMPSGLDYAITRPLACLVLQGGKQVMMGTRTFNFGAGDSLLITADVPTVSQIVQASPEAPYISLVIDLNPALLTELMEEMKSAPNEDGGPISNEPTDAEVAEAALRLMRLLGRPTSAAVLHASLLRELHYWLLVGRHGAAISRLGWPDGHAQRIARAVKVLRTEFTRPLTVEHLASVAGMSASSFHQHFRNQTSLTPLQFQKQLRLIEARRLMLGQGATASSAAFAVGYESVSQFSREYRRLFGLPPARDTSTGCSGDVQSSACTFSNRADRDCIQ
ncbi:AraC family transcriptional regulator [Ectopseudomonas alcaliphila]|uniref:AraC family transcriptional regulator n=1 Tax=Ectopseudomonas alcaliphila TaxID=101564 RepID=UPI00278A8878|nr:MULTISPECIES: AraC family transcriptional regulator [Pseudomonas]MDP9941019.1 AraC-like DNA-binding protein [Pseudomonas sp. 3400]MDR7013238.1 AraC-like DNA-binding protein [Pseudomonas alcaliphila]